MRIEASSWKVLGGLGGSVRGSLWLGLAHTHLSSTAPGNLAVRTATRQPKHLPRHLLASVLGLAGHRPWAIVAALRRPRNTMLTPRPDCC